MEQVIETLYSPTATFEVVKKSGLLGATIVLRKNGASYKSFSSVQHAIEEAHRQGAKKL